MSSFDSNIANQNEQMSKGGAASKIAELLFELFQTDIQHKVSLKNNEVIRDYDYENGEN
jgi:hypothetical protein